MNNFKNILIALLLVFACTLSYAQQSTIQLKGKVIDSYTKAPIAGAMVKAEEMETSVITDDNGLFTLDLSALKGEIRVWASGSYTQIIPIAGRSYIEISMIPLNKFLHTENIQIPNIGVISANEKISNLYSTDNTNINLNKSSVEQILRSIPGIQVVDKSGMPGEGSYFSMRGSNTFYGKSAPLIVLNGVPMVFDTESSPLIGGFSRGILNGINAQDIQNLTVLRGSEAATYGSMGSNGVIIIETERAVDMNTKVEFIGNYGVDMNQNTFPVLGVNGYKNLVNDVAVSKYSNVNNILGAFPFLSDDPNYFLKYLYNNNTDWQKQIYSPGFITDNLIKVKGGDAIVKYDMSVGYLGRNGQLKNTDYQRYYGRFNTDVTLSHKFSLTTTLSTSYAESNLLETGMINETNPLLAAMRKSPMLSIYEKDKFENIRPDYASIRDANGKLIENNSVSNPVALVNTMTATNKNYDIQLSAGLSYDVNKNIKITGLFGMYYNMSRESLFVPGKTKFAIMPLDEGLAQNTARAGISEVFNTYYALGASYNKTFNQIHKLRASVNGQINLTSSEYDAGQGRNTSSDFYKTINWVNSVGRKFFGYNEVWNWVNYNASVRYIYNNILGANIVASYDGASSVGSDANRFRIFPAAGVAFYAKNIGPIRDANWINRLTLRLDYTVTGNSQYASSLSKYVYHSQKIRELSGIVRIGTPNTKIKPEINSTASVGLDVSLFNNRVEISADYYDSRTSDVIIPKEISSGFGTNSMYENMAKIQNRGIEASVNVAVIQKKDLRWYVGFTLAKNENKVLSLGSSSDVITEMPDGSALITKVGLPMYMFYGYQANGVYSTTAQAQASGLRNSGGVPFGAGDVIYTDFDNNGIINTKDRTTFGSAAPNIFGTIFTNLQYKRFQLSATFGYSYRSKGYNAVRRQMESMSDFGNQALSVNSRWVMEGQNTTMPKAVYGDPMGNSRFSNRFVEFTSYLKLKEIMLSYDFDALNGITVYAVGENLFTMTNYLGLDPEFAYSYGATLQGFDYAKVPLGRSVKIGLKIKF